jgi:hypothetical protein
VTWPAGTTMRREGDDGFGWSSITIVSRRAATAHRAKGRHERTCLCPYVTYFVLLVKGVYQQAAGIASHASEARRSRRGHERQARRAARPEPSAFPCPLAASRPAQQNPARCSHELARFELYGRVVDPSRGRPKRAVRTLLTHPTWLIGLELCAIQEDDARESCQTATPEQRPSPGWRTNRPALEGEQPAIASCNDVREQMVGEPLPGEHDVCIELGPVVLKAVSPPFDVCCVEQGQHAVIREIQIQRGAKPTGLRSVAADRVALSLSRLRHSDSTVVCKKSPRRLDAARKEASLRVGSNDNSSVRCPRSVRISRRWRLRGRSQRDACERGGDQRTTGL